MIPLTLFSHFYYLSNSGNGANRKYDVFNRNGPTFFKILGNDEIFTAKRVRSDALYTNTRYVVVSQNKWAFQGLIDETDVSNTFTFNTMNANFAGLVLTIPKKTQRIDSLLQSWGYQLEASKSLSLLWPPALANAEITEITSDSAFLYTSFMLQPYGNINLESKNIVRLVGGVSRISVADRMKVFRKNAEIILEQVEQEPLPFEERYVEEVEGAEFTVSNKDTHILFTRFGVTQVSEGQRLFLAQRNEVRQYFHTYPTKIIRPSRN